MIQQYATAQNVLPLILFSCLLLWPTWWIYRFVLFQAFYPAEPQQLPYWIPFFGHVRALSMDMDGLFTYGREYFGNDRTVFSITVMGQVLYVVTSPDDVVTVYNNTNTNTLDYNGQIKDILGLFGLNERTMDLLFAEQSAGKSWMDKSHDKFRSQMHPGEKLDVLQANLLSNLDHNLSWDLLPESLVFGATNENEKTVSLYRWCLEALINAGAKAFFGESLYRLNPELPEDFLVFDDEAWKLYSKYPYYAAKKMYDYKAKCEAAFQKYIETPKDERKDASWIMQSIEEDLIDLGVTEKSQLAPNFLILHRLVNTNAYKQCFWCLAYLLHNEELLQEVKAELQSAFQADGQLSITYLVDNCPLVNSLYEENLRLCNAPIGARQVVSNFLLGNKILTPGRTLLMPYRQLHFNQEVFGSNSGDFDPTRFLKKKNLARSTSYRPFGGGSTYCPGRFLAKREVLMFVAVVLFRYDISLVGKNGQKPEFPRMNVTIPSGGIMGPVAGDDVIVKVRRAKHGHKVL